MVLYGQGHKKPLKAILRRLNALVMVLYGEGHN